MPSLYACQQIQYLSMEHRGKYRCEISSNNESTWTNEVEVVVGMSHDFLYLYHSRYVVGPNVVTPLC